MDRSGKEPMEPKRAYVMCGVPGSGKSTHVRQICQEHPDALVVSYDNIREELYGDANIQGYFPDIYRKAVEMIEGANGRPIILDNTHVLAKYRRDALDLLSQYGYTEVSLVIVDKPLATCLSQNASRNRKVPEEVIESMYESLQSSLASDENLHNLFSTVTHIH